MTTLNLQVAASADDAKYSATLGTVLTDAPILLGSAAHWGGVRFAGATVPQGATINTATLQLYLPGPQANLDFDVYGEDSDDAASFISGGTDLIDRPLTTAKTNVLSLGETTGVFYSIDVASIVQEIVNRAGWAGDGIAFIIDELDSSHDVAFDTYDVSSANAPKLDIDYTAAGGGGHAGPVVSAVPLKSKLRGLVS